MVSDCSAWFRVDGLLSTNEEKKKNSDSELVGKQLMGINPRTCKAKERVQRRERA